MGYQIADMEKLGAVVMLAEPKSAAQIKNLAESLDLFDFAPGAHYAAGVRQVHDPAVRSFRL